MEHSLRAANLSASRLAKATSPMPTHFRASIAACDRTSTNPDSALPMPLCRSGRLGQSSFGFRLRLIGPTGGIQHGQHTLDLKQRAHMNLPHSICRVHAGEVREKSSLLPAQNALRQSVVSLYVCYRHQPGLETHDHDPMEPRAVKKRFLQMAELVQQ